MSEAHVTGLSRSARRRVLRRNRGRTGSPAQKKAVPFLPVDIAQASDAQDLYEFLLTVRTEIGDGTATAELIGAMAKQLAERDGGVAFLVRGNTAIEASIGIAFVRPWWRFDHDLVVRWCHVAPECRDLGHAKSLLRAGRDFADRIGRPLLVEEITGDIDLLAHAGKDEGLTPKLRLYHRTYSAVGGIFRYQPALAERGDVG